MASIVTTGGGRTRPSGSILLAAREHGRRASSHNNGGRPSVPPQGAGRQPPKGAGVSPRPPGDSKESQGKAASVLIVEDEGLVALSLQRKLRAFGYTTPEHAVTGEEAVEKAKEHRPSLLLMDIRLAGPMDGITAAAEIQRAMDVPVVYLSAYADDATLERARQTNAFGYLMKPFDDQTLRATVEAALSGRRSGPFAEGKTDR